MMIEIFLCFFLLIISGVFSASESGIFSLEASSLARERGYHISVAMRKKLVILISWVKKPEKILVGILFANVLINISFTYIFDQILLSGFTSSQPLLRTLIITFILLLFGEIIPKIAVLSYARQWSLWVTPFLHYWSFAVFLISTPILAILDKILLYFFPKGTFLLDKKELLETLEQSHFQGILSQGEERKLKQYIYFQTSDVYSIMIPKQKCLIIHDTLKVAKVKQLFLNHFENMNNSFALVYDANKKKFLGYIGKKQLFLSLYKKEKMLFENIQPLLYIPSTLSLMEALERFMNHNQEVGLVLSEDGYMTGSITLKYILNALIRSQDYKYQSYDMTGKLIRYLKNNTYKISGETTIDLFNQYFSSNLYSDSAKTINSFIIQLVDGFPEKSTKVKIERYRFQNFILSNNQIVSCNVKISEQIR